jgi:acyl dehydratase
MENKLPFLKDMIFPSFFTLIKGVKIKKEGIRISKDFKNVKIDMDSLEKYRSFFNWQQPYPFAFFYLMAQRAQTSIMLNADFTIAIPGLVHISNRIEKLDTIDYDLPFDLIVNVDVPYKEKGSLIPRFTVDFLQNNKTVIRCESTYIAKRKGGISNTAKEKTNDAFITHADTSQIWEIDKNLGKLYASASGDKNPIHSSFLFAKLIGFSRPILQGWYSVSRIINEYELATNAAYSSIEVDFKSPILLPSKQKIELQYKENKETLFQIADLQSNKIVLYGKIK